MQLNLYFCPSNAPIWIRTRFHLSSSIRLALGCALGFFLSLPGWSGFLGLLTFLTVLRKAFFFVVLCRCVALVDITFVSFILNKVLNLVVLHCCLQCGTYLAVTSDRWNSEHIILRIRSVYSWFFLCAPVTGQCCWWDSIPVWVFLLLVVTFVLSNPVPAEWCLSVDSTQGAV